MVRNFIDTRVSTIKHSYRSTEGELKTEVISAGAGYNLIRDMLAGTMLKGTKHRVTSYFNDAAKVYYLHAIELSYRTRTALHEFEYMDGDGNVLY